MRWSGNIHDSGSGRRSEEAEGQNFKKILGPTLLRITRHNADRKRENLPLINAENTDKGKIAKIAKIEKTNL
ncbi:MAG TPA: hypothetical protein VGK24_07095 [Candidatus Angelobacter sp.]|jgi:hypothetical protein